VATVFAGLARAVAAGTAGIKASFTDWVTDAGCLRHHVTYSSASSASVTTVSIVGGNNYIFEGSDATVKQYNLEQAQGNPTGGQYSWSASNSRVSFDNPAAALAKLTGTSPSTGLLDTLLTVNYTYNGQPATPATRYITVRIFRYLQQSGQTQVILLNGPSQYGYNAYAYYNIYTNPGGQLVASGFSGMATLESVTINSISPPNVIVTLHQGPGATNNNSQIVDDLSAISSSPFPQNLDIKASQTLSVGGIYVRSNSLDYTSSGPAITNNGPFN
jgi:hypothetical protein